MKVNLSEVIGVVIRKTLEFKNVEGFTKEEFKEFWTQLKQDDEFLDAYKNCIRSDNDTE